MRVSSATMLLSNAVASTKVVGGLGTLYNASTPGIAPVIFCGNVSVL